MKQPQDYSYYYDLGNAYYKVDKYEEAAAAFSKATELNPSFAWAFGNLAGALTEAGRYEEALTAVEKAIALTPDDEDFLANRKDIVEYLENARNSRPPVELATQALFQALQKFDGRTAIQLVQQGARADARDPLGNTPLHYFYQCQSLQTCKDLASTLLQHGADLEAKNDRGETPIIKLQGIKAKKHKDELTSHLVDLGAQWDPQKAVEKTARIEMLQEAVEGHSPTSSLLKIRFGNFVARLFLAGGVCMILARFITTWEASWLIVAPISIALVVAAFKITKSLQDRFPAQMTVGRSALPSTGAESPPLRRNVPVVPREVREAVLEYISEIQKGRRLAMKGMRFYIPRSWSVEELDMEHWILRVPSIQQSFEISIKAAKVNVSPPISTFDELFSRLEERFRQEAVLEPPVRQQVTERRVAGLLGLEYSTQSSDLHILGYFTPAPESDYEIRITAPDRRTLNFVRPIAEVFLANCSTDVRLRQGGQKSTAEDDKLNTYSKIIHHLTTQFQKGQVSVICGAGISYDSGLPLAGGLMNAILDTCGATEQECERINESGLPFEAFMDAVAEHSAIKQLWKIFKQGEPNANHTLLANLMLSGRLQTVVTTNFDTLIEDALESCAGKSGLASRWKVYKNLSGSEEPPLPGSDPSLVKIHGCITKPKEMAITMRHVASKQLAKSRENTIRFVFADGPHSTVLILGYSASDAFDILPAIRAITNSDKKLIWVNHDTKTEQVESFWDTTTENPFGSQMNGKVLRCDTGKLLKDLGERLGVDAIPNANNKAQWSKCIGEWFDKSSQEYFPAFSEAVLARILVDALHPNLALRHWDNAIAELTDKTSDALRARILNNSGAALGICGKNERAHHRLVESLILLRKIGNRKQESNCLCDIGQNHAAVGKYQHAAGAFTDGLKIAEDINDKSLIARNSGNLGNCYGSLGQLAEALPYFSKAVSAAQEIGDKTAEGTFLVNTARVHEQLNDHLKAVRDYDEGLQTLEAALGADNHVVFEARQTLATAKIHG